MITFRKDTSFPFLRIARDFGASYDAVLFVADLIERGKEPIAATPGNAALIWAVEGAVCAEHERRVRI